MGISIVLQNEAREILERFDDLENLLHGLLPENQSASMLSCIDPYGDTIFNRLQMGQFLAEWDDLEKETLTHDQHNLIQRVRHLAQRCSDEPHLYLAFIGD